MTVTASNLNIAPEELADRTAWLMGISANEVSGANFGVVADDAAVPGAGTDNASALAAAVTYLAGQGGGWLVLPPGRIRSTAVLARPHSVHIRAAVPGQTIFAIDHATADSTQLTSGTAKQKSIIYGVVFEADQVNTGKVFRGDAAGQLQLVQCAVNRDDTKLHGVLFDTTAEGVETWSCNLVSALDAGTAIQAGTSFHAHGGSLTLAPAATVGLILSFDTLLDGVELIHHSTVGGIAFVADTGGGRRTRIRNCKVTYSNVSAPAPTYLLQINSAGWAQVGGNDLAQLTRYYLISSAPLLGGSELQGIPHLSDTIAATYTVPDEYESAWIKFTGAAAPTVNFPHITRQGQPFALGIENGHGSSTWAGAPVLAPQGSDDIFFQSSGLSGLASASALTLNFVSMFLPTSATNAWVQVGAAGVLS